MPAFYDFYQWAKKKPLIRLKEWGRKCKCAASARTTTSSILPGPTTNTDADRTAADGAPQQSKQSPDISTRPKFVDKSEQLLGPLCDLQAITSLSIVIAGLSTYKTISFYHEQLVISYWNVTLNSFWASRAEFMDLNDGNDQNTTQTNAIELRRTHHDTGSMSLESGLPKSSTRNPVKRVMNRNNDLRVIVRRLSILASCILGASFQTWAALREYRHWNKSSKVNDRCYNYRDGSSPWPWVAGILIFCLTLALTLLPTTRKLVKCYLDRMKCVKSWFQNEALVKICGWLIAAWSVASTGTSPNTSISTSMHSRTRAIFGLLGGFILFLLTGFAFVLFWLSQIWLSVWAYGDTEYRITWCFYLGFGIWNSVDIITLRNLNRHLLNEDEFQWGFGQVLPLVMLLAIVYNVLDALFGMDNDGQ